VVEWFVLKDPVVISQAQKEAYKAKFPVGTNRMLEPVYTKDGVAQLYTNTLNISRDQYECPTTDGFYMVNQCTNTEIDVPIVEVPVVEPCVCPIGRRRLLINPALYECSSYGEGFELQTQKSDFVCPDMSVIECSGPAWECYNAGTGETQEALSAGEGGDAPTIELPIGGGDDGGMMVAPTPKPKGKKGKKGRAGMARSPKPKRSKPPRKTRDPSATPKPKPTHTPKPAPSPKPAHTPKPKGTARPKGTPKPKGMRHDAMCVNKGFEYRKCIQEGETFRARTAEDPAFVPPACDVSFEEAGDRRRLKGGAAYQQAMGQFKENCMAAGMGCKTKGKTCGYSEATHLWHAKQEAKAASTPL